MDSIRDLSWVKHIHTAAIQERATMGGYRLLALSLPRQDNRAPTQYLYRLLAFPVTGHKPVLALNLELSILGTACLTEQSGAGHTRHETVDQDMSYAEFREWAFARAEQALGAESAEKPAVATL